MVRPRITLAAHPGEIFALAWGQLDDRPVLATGSGYGGVTGMVRLWDPDQGGELRTLAAAESGGVFAVAWGQLGDRPVLAAGGDDGSVRLWDPEQGQELRTPLAHPGGIFAAAWGQPDGRPVLVSGGVDGTVELWDLVIERSEDRIPGYRADDPGGPDWLRRSGEAAALAEMITAQSARPPLAIGLFGDWGEGKTHFLHLIAKHVDDLAAAARDKPEEDPLTYSGVRQV